jgi:hypothetical protein
MAPSNVCYRGNSGHVGDASPSPLMPQRRRAPAPYSITFPARELAPKAELEQFVVDCQSGIISRSTVG